MLWIKRTERIDTHGRIRRHGSRRCRFGVVEVFYKNHDSIISRAGTDVDLKYILDIRDFPDLPYSDKFTKNFEDILNDPEVEVVAEVMGGLKPAYDFTKRLLLAGKKRCHLEQGACGRKGRRAS